jgi:hypothetical protein
MTSWQKIVRIFGVEIFVERCRSIARSLSLYRALVLRSERRSTSLNRNDFKAHQNQNPTHRSPEKNCHALGFLLQFAIPALET